MDIYEISVKDHEDTITLLNRALLPENFPELPEEKLFPFGDKFYFASDRSGKELSDSIHMSFERYKGVVAELEWLLSLRFRQVSDDTVEVRSGLTDDRLPGGTD